MEFRILAIETNILIYTEYKDSQQRLVEALLAAGFIQPLTLSGEDSEGDRLTINTIFRTQSNASIRLHLSRDWCSIRV